MGIERNPVVVGADQAARSDTLEAVHEAVKERAPKERRTRNRCPQGAMAI